MVFEVENWSQTSHPIPSFLDQIVDVSNVGLSSSSWGVPVNWWFIRDHPIEMDDEGGYPHDYGNLHIVWLQPWIAGFFHLWLLSILYACSADKLSSHDMCRKGNSWDVLWILYGKHIFCTYCILRCFMYGILTNTHRQSDPTVGTCSIHETCGSVLYRYVFCSDCFRKLCCQHFP